jgi:hypothetical protein
MNTRTARLTAVAVTVFSAGLYACTDPPTLESVLVRPTGIAAVGASFTIAAGGTQPNPALVRLRDQQDEPLPNWVVAFTATAGTLSSPTATTNAQGEASPASWTAPNTAGQATITATVPDFSLAPVGFTAVVVAGPAASMTATSSTNNQTGVAGSAVTFAPEVTVVDQFGNPKSGTSVTFAIDSGGGTLNGSSLTSVLVTSDANGKAKPTSWVLGTSVGVNGVNTVRVTSAALSGQTVTFRATATAGPVTSIVIAPGSPSSQNQTAIGGSPVAVSPAVRFQDANGNVVGNVVARFTVASGAGKILANSGDATGSNSLDATTTSAGIATIFGWRLGTLSGGSATNTLSVSAPGAASVTPLVITATATAGPPASITNVVETPSSNNQTALKSAAVAVAPGVVVRDASNNVVASASVTFTVAGGSGSIKATPAGAAIATANITTDASGVARVASWTLGSLGINNLTAAVTSNSGLSFTFTATGVLGPPKTIVIAPPGNSQDQTAVAGSNVSTAPAVLVSDSAGNALGGVTVRFAIQNGGGKIKLSDGSETATLNVVSNASGIASVFAWMLWQPGTNTLTVTIPAVPTVPAFTISATSNAGPPASIAIIAENPRRARPPLWEPPCRSLPASS